MDEQDSPNEDSHDEDEDLALSKEQAKVTPKDEEKLHEGDDDPDDDDGEDPIAAAVEAIVKQREEKARKDALAEAKLQRDAEAAEAAAAQQEELRKKKLNDSFVDTAKRTKASLEKLSLRDEDGDPIKLTDEIIQEFIEPWREHNGVVQQTIVGTAEQSVYQNLAQAALALIPEDKHEEFSTRAGGKPLNEYLKVLAELNAPNTEYAKSLAEDSEVKVKAAYARGFAKGQKAPPGTPAAPQESGIKPGEKADLTSLVGAIRAFNRGLIDNTKLLEIMNNRNN